MEKLDLTKILQEILSKFGGAIPSIISAIIIFILGWIISGVISRLLRKMLEKIGIDRFADRLEEIDLISKMKVEVKPSRFISKVIYYLLMLVTLMVASAVSKLQELSDLVEKIIDYAPKFLSAFIILIIGLVIADFIKKIIKTACDSVGVPSGSIISSFVFYFIFITVIIISLEQIGIPTDLLETNVTIIIAGIVLAFGIGYGISSIKIMSSMLSSFFYSKGKVEVGMTVKIDEDKGKVVAMDSTSITLLKEDNTSVIFPLSRLAETKIEIFN